MQYTEINELYGVNYVSIKLFFINTLWEPDTMYNSECLSNTCIICCKLT